MNNMKNWAIAAWKLSIDFDGTMSGGIDPPKRMVDYKVVDNRTVEIRYKLPETCGLSDVRYHVIEPRKIRVDRVTFSEKGEISINGENFPGSYAEDPWTARESENFLRSYNMALCDILTVRQEKAPK